MHFFKWIGLALLFASGLAVGYLLSAFESRRYRQAEGFLALLRHVRLQIDCFSLPVSRILAGLDERIRRLCGAPQGAVDFPALLSETKLLLPEEACALLYDFSEHSTSKPWSFPLSFR